MENEFVDQSVEQQQPQERSDIIFNVDVNMKLNGDKFEQAAPRN